MSISRIWDIVAIVLIESILHLIAPSRFLLDGHFSRLKDMQDSFMRGLGLLLRMAYVLAIALECVMRIILVNIS